MLKDAGPETQRQTQRHRDFKELIDTVFLGFSWVNPGSDVALDKLSGKSKNTCKQFHDNWNMGFSCSCRQDPIETQEAYLFLGSSFTCLVPFMSAFVHIE